MNRFEVIASIGHCGTKWLTTVFDGEQGWKGFHELKQTEAGMSWHRCAEYERRNGVESAKYRPYFEKIQGALARRNVVEANSWAPYLLPELHEKQPIDRVIYLVRHGVSQLHSLATASAVWRDSALDDYAMDGYLLPFYELVGEPGPAWENWGRWERLCLLWASSGVVPDWLREQGLTVEVYRFEDLTQTTALQDLIPSMSHARTLHWRARDINRKVEGSRRPGDIWLQWNPEQREALTRICGEAMDHYGYEIPGEG